MATPGADEDHDMDDQSDVEDETLADVRDDDANANGHHETVESSTPTNYSLFDIHPRLGILRQQLHDLEHPIELPKADFESIIPYMDNVWRKLKTSEQTEASQNTELYWCKLRKHPGAKPHVPRPTPEGKQARRRKPKEEKACSMAMKVVYNFGPIDKVTIKKAVEGEKHTHDLEFMDQQKRNSGVMDTARREAVRGFQPASIWWKMQQEQEKLENAGGKHMKISDVRNVQYPWRQENPDVILKAHTGYNSARTGPKPGQSQNHRPKSSPSQAAVLPTPPISQVPPSSHLQPPPGYAQPPHPPPPPHAQHPPHGQPPPPHYHPLPPPPPPEVLHFPPEASGFLSPYLPDPAAIATKNRPHVTLTWASSLDGRIASSPGYRTALSGPETKAMTHFLRSTHDAILIGVRTAIADDPSLNCRLSGAGGFGGPGIKWQPRPIIVDPTGRLRIRPEMKILQVAVLGRAKAPWIIVGPNAQLPQAAVQTLKAHGGEYLMINDVDQYGRFNWEGIFQVLFREGIKSIMVEGGGLVLSELLSRRYASIIESVIMTIAPTFLGRMGVQVTQETEMDNTRAILQNNLQEVTWRQIGGKDMVMCGKLEQPQSQSNGILQGIVEMANADNNGNAQHRPPPPNPPPHHPPPAQQSPREHRPPQQGPPPPGPPQRTPPQPQPQPYHHPQAPPPHQSAPPQHPTAPPQHPPAPPPQHQPAHPPQHQPGPPPPRR